MLKPGKKAVLFDMWGTLLYEEPLFSTAGPDSFFGVASASLNVPLEAFRVARDATVPQAMTGQMDGTARHLRVMTLLGLPPNQEQARYLSDLEDQLRLAAIHLYPNTVSTLAAVRARGYQTALVSNCTTVFPPIIKHLQLAGMLDTLILSCELGAAKPDPRIFLAACQALEVQPHECFYVGDGGDNEMEASSTLGMTSILIVQPGSHAFTRLIKGQIDGQIAGQEFTVRDLSEILESV